MPVRTDATTATQKWVSRLSGATAQIQAGVNRVTIAPGQQAAAAKDKWLARVTASQQKWATNVSKVSLADWQSAMNNIGVSRIASGAQAKQGKMQSFMSSFLPYLQTQVAQIDKMPSTTLEDNIARATAMIRANAAFKRPANS